MAASGDLVMVSGGSGFLASWIIVNLLRRGYRVRATVRSPARVAPAKAAIAGAVDAGDRLSFVVADLLGDAGWDEAVRDARYVIHPASPMQIGEYAKSDVIRPAREGVARILAAAKAAGVEHLVMTSSVEACRSASTAPGSETDWTDLTGDRVSDYTKAKTLGERDAWDWARDNGPPTLTTILPGFIQGPVLGADFSGSVELVARLLRGEVAVAPRLGYSIVDVRDVAELHVEAMTAPAARGRRLIATGEFLWILDIVEALRAQCPDRASKLPSKEAPDALIKAAAVANPEMKAIIHDLGRRQTFDAGLALRLLGWSARPARNAVLDGAKSLIRLGLA
jgi:dihydroflavonol-4-reductase